MKLKLIMVFLGISLVVAATQAEEQNPNIPPLKTIFERVYGDISAFDISEKEKEAMKKSGNSPVYGELLPNSILPITRYMNEKLNAFFGDKMPKNISFMDIGSGAGKVILGACMKGPFHKCIGVEYSKERHAIATQAYQKITSKWPQFIPEGREVVFINADALTVNMCGIHAIYISSYCFEESFMKKLLVKFEKELPDGAVIVTSQAFSIMPQSRVKLIRIFTIPQSWKSDSKAYAYQVGIQDVKVQNDVPAHWRASSR